MTESLPIDTGQAFIAQSVFYREGPTMENDPWLALITRGHSPEQHLLAPSGRMNSFLNVANNGVKIMGLLSMSDDFADLTDIQDRISRTAGMTVASKFNTKSHLEHSVRPVGAVESDPENIRWRRTAFGSAIIPAIIYFAENIEGIDLNPAKSLASMSKFIKDNEGNIVSSSPLERAKILMAISYFGINRILDLKPYVLTTPTSIRLHLNELVAAGLVSRRSVDVDSSISEYSVTSEGHDSFDWGVFKEPRKKRKPGNLFKVSRAIQETVNALEAEGVTDISARKVVDYAYTKQGKTFNRSLVNSVLRFFSDNGMLLDMHPENKDYSEISLTEKGDDYVVLLKNIASFMSDPESVEEIKAISQALSPYSEKSKLEGVEANYPGLTNKIAKRFLETAPHKSLDQHAKLEEMIVFIRDNNGQSSVSDVARACRVSEPTTRFLLEPYMNSGNIIAAMRLGVSGKRQGRKQYLTYVE